MLGVIALIAVAGGAWVYSIWNTYTPKTYVQETTTSGENGAATTTQVTVDTSAGTATPGAPAFTMSDVAAHNDASSCYAVIRSKVYDFTLWVNMHPGGKQAILSLCGTDGTARFEAHHGNERKPNQTLARFLIGNLSQ